MSVNCVYCGHVNPDGSTVCLSCGRTLPPAPSGGASSYGQQQPQAPSWGQPPSNQPQAPSYPPPPATSPYGGSYPPPQQPPPPSYPPPAPSYPPPAPSYPPPAPPQDPNAWQGGYGGQPSSFGNQPPGQPAPPPSFGTPQQPGYGASSFPPPAPAPSFGQPAAWGAQPQAYGAPGADAQSGKTMAMIGMSVGILGVLAGWCCYSGFLFGPAALILGFIAKSKLSSAGSQDGNGMAMTAIATGAIATVEPIVWIVFWLIVAGSLSAIN